MCGCCRRAAGEPERPVIVSGLRTKAQCDWIDAQGGLVLGCYSRQATPLPTNGDPFEETGVTAHRWIDLGHPTAPIDPDPLDRSMIADYVCLGMRPSGRKTWLGAEARE